MTPPIYRIHMTALNEITNKANELVRILQCRQHVSDAQDDTLERGLSNIMDELENLEDVLGDGV